MVDYRCEASVRPRTGIFARSTAAVLRIGHVELVIGAAVGAVTVRDVGDEAARRPAHARERLAVRVHEPDRAAAGMRDREVAGFVHREAVGTGGAVKLEEIADLRERAVGHERPPPDAVAAGRGDEEHLFGRVEHEAVGARHVREQQFQPPVGAQAVHAPGRIVQAGLALVGEKDVAGGADREVVEALEAFRIAMGEHRADRAGRGIQLHEAAPVVGDENAAVLVDAQSVGPAVVFACEGPVACGRNAEDAAERDIDHVEVARAVEGRALEEAVDRRAALVRVGPGRALAFARGNSPASR